jgi:hypothetical protein
MIFVYLFPPRTHILPVVLYYTSLSFITYLLTQHRTYPPTLTYSYLHTYVLLSAACIPPLDHSHALLTQGSERTQPRS